MFSPTPEWVPNDGRDRSPLPDRFVLGHQSNMYKTNDENAYSNPALVLDKF